MSTAEGKMFDAVNSVQDIKNLLSQLRITGSGYPSNFDHYSSVRAYLAATSTQSWQTRGYPYAINQKS
jgi:hypothetical protein